MGLSIAATSTMTSVEPGVLDANVLAYAINADAAQHLAARTLLQAARDPSTSLYVTSQILCEFYSIITNVRRFPKAVSPPEAVRILSTMLALPGLRILPTPSQVVAGRIHLLGRHAVERAGVFDLQTVATMLANGVPRVYTFNPVDFQVFAELTVVTPT
jgi:predicted nucleic acid-binding protein